MLDQQNLPALPPNIRDLIAEYDAKCEACSEEIAAFVAAKERIERNSQVGACYKGQPLLSFQSDPSEKDFAKKLKKSSWHSAIEITKVREMMPASDRSQLDMSMENPPAFTEDNILASLGDYVSNPRFHVLRGLAECFTALDPFYKSHDNFAIGVKGLPKRVILNNFETKHYGPNFDKLRDVINALLVYRGAARLSDMCLRRWMTYTTWQNNLPEHCPSKSYRDGEFVTHQGEVYYTTGYGAKGAFALAEQNKTGWHKWEHPVPDLTLKLHSTTVHLYFGADALADINAALAEFYGDVLADCPEEKPQKRAQSTAVSKDLAFYPTPQEVVEKMISELTPCEGDAILEPSCGDGQILLGLQKYAREARLNSLKILGIEVDAKRAQQARDRGFAVHKANFLQISPEPKFDKIYMNPPFCGQHYLKHITHATKFLKPGGCLIAVLPAAAWYHHQKLPGKSCNDRWTHDVWRDLPCASFRQSGTNIGTGLWKYSKSKEAA